MLRISGIFFMIFMTYVNSIYSQADKWVSIGPEGGWVIGIKAAPSNINVVYSSVNYASIFKSIDGGKSWNLFKWFPKGIRAFEIDPKNPDIIYAASDSLFVTRNGGADWINVNCPATGIISIVADPIKPERIYITSIYNNSTGLWKTEDSGKNWEVVPGKNFFRKAAVSPQSNNIVYAISSDAKIFRSSDYGNSFAQIGSINYYGVVTGFLLDPVDNQRIYVSGSEGVFKSSDGGVTWALRNNGDIDKNHTWTENIFVHPLDPAYLYRSGNNSYTFISRDYGENWQATLLPSGSMTITADNTLLVGTMDGVYASSRDCQNFHISSKGLNGTSIKSIAVSSRADHKVLGLVENQHIFKAHLYTLSSDSTSWNKAYWGKGASQIKVSPFNQRFIAGGFNWGPGSINISQDGGITWQQKFFDNYIFSVEFSSYDSSVIYAGGRSGLFKSTDKGNEWSQVVFPGYDPGYYHTVNDISCGDNDSTIFLCLDESEDWTLSHTLLSSEDMGKIWKDHNIKALSVLVVPDKSGLVLCGTTDPSGRLIRSTDKGKSWNKIVINDDNTGVNAFEYNNRIIYAGTNHGVFYSEDYGLTWNKLGNDMPVENIGSIGLSATKPPVIYAGTISGVYKYDIDKLNNIVKKGNNNLEFGLSNNFPNPFNPTTNISYIITKQSHVELRIFDLLGREVAVLVNEQKSAGEYKVQFNGASLPSGVYIYTLKAGSFTESKKLIILK